MTYDDFTKGMTGEQLAYAQNLQSQRDDGYAAQQKAADALAAKEAEHTNLVEGLNATHAAEIAAREIKLAEAAKLIEVLGGTECGQKLAREKQIAELEAEASRKAKEAAEIAKRVEELKNTKAVESTGFTGMNLQAVKE